MGIGIGDSNPAERGRGNQEGKVSETIELRWTWLGRVAYARALQIQRALRDRVIAGTDPGALLLLEHPPVLTQGRHGRDEHLVAAPAELERLGIEVHRIERGGDVTYHGPGQLVGYPILPVRGGVKRFVKALADAAAQVLADWGIESFWDDARPGLWTKSGKIAAVGLHVARGVALHGIALNVDPDLEHYRLIVPCGLAGSGVTSMARLLGTAPPLPEVAERFAAAFTPAPGVGRRTRLRPEALLHEAP